jgi:hypothetical protein
MGGIAVRVFWCTWHSLFGESQYRHQYSKGLSGLISVYWRPLAVELHRSG